MRILGTASGASDFAIAGLLDEFNRMRTAFLGTGRRMVYELPSDGAGPGERGS